MADPCIYDLAGDILQDCNTVYGTGVEQTAYLIKKSDIDLSASTYAKPKITKLAIQSGKRAFKFVIPAKSPYDGLIYEDQNVDVGISFNKTLPLRMLADTPDNSKNIEAFKLEKWVAIYENRVKGSDDDPAFCVIGWEQGASMQNATLDKYGDGYNGGWGGDLIEEGAITPQIFFDAGGITATRAALESLCTAQE